MSRVFVAEELRLKRKVVVKVLSPELAQGISVERFEREIQTVAALQHANIVPVHTAGDTNGLPFYTMPFVEGESLRARLGRGPMAVTEVIGVLRDVTRALAYAHQRGVVHRDIKPDNVLMSGGAAVVTDFGIAKAISAARTASGGATLTQIGTSIGTPAYMAPEQAAGEPDIDHRADIYALGAMAYELLSGQAVFAGRTAQRMLAAHMGEAPKPIADFRGDLPASLAELVMSCLAKEPKDRPQTAGDIARALDTITSGGGMPAMPPVLLGGPGMFRKALALYAVAFVAVAILAKAAIVGIGLPDWVFPGSLVVMALGLPVVLWTGYVQRVTRRAMTMTPTYTPGGSPAMAQGTMATMALKAAPRMSWTRTARGGMYALGTFVVIIGVFMVMRVFGIGPAATLLGTGALKAKEPIVMTDFSVTNGDTSLARVVSFAVRTGLTQSPVLSIMDQTAAAGALERMERPRNTHIDLPLAQGIALREGAKAIVDGELTTIGTGYVLTLRLLTADSARVLASFQASGDGPKGLIEAADKVARDLRAKAGESLRSVQNAVPLARARTSSLEALRLYSEGNFANNVETDWAKAMRLLKQAVAIDTTFAEGWRKLSVAMSNLRLPRAQVDSAVTRAFRLRGRLPEGEQASIEAYYYGNGGGHDRAKAIAAYERAAATIGNNNNLIIQLVYRREFARAESLSRADLASDPSSALAHRNLVWLAEQRGKQAAADSALAAMIKRFPRSTYPRQMAVMATFSRGRFDEAQRQLDSASRVRDDRDPAWVLENTANLALLRGQLGKWRQYRALRTAADSAVGRRPPVALEAASEMGIAAAVRGSAEAERKKLEDALTRKPLRTFPDVERPDLWVAWNFAMAGHPDRARAILSEFRSSVRDTALLRSVQPDVHNVLGMIALAEKKGREAAAEFQRGDSLPDGPSSQSALSLPRNLGQAFDAANQPDSAIAQYEKYLGTPEFWRIPEDLDPTSMPAIHERLGQLYEAKGNAAKAAGHYRAFIELWKNADAELQPRVAEARKRLAKVNPVEKPQ
jgi:Tfp pilus assembly protein PilF